MVAGINKRPCILMADEYELMQEALCVWLMRVLPDATVIGVSSSQGKFKFRPDCLSLILFALRQPYHHSFIALQDFRKRFPYIPLVLMSDVVDDRITAVARAQGVSALVQTSDSADVFLEVIRLTLKGKPYLFPERRKNLRSAEYNFSPRQAEVLELLCEGKSNKEIAAVLKMSDNTVRTHVSAIFNKLGVRNRTEAVISGRHLI